MTLNDLLTAPGVSDSLIDRLAEEVRLEIQRRRAATSNSAMHMAGEEMRMPIVLRGRSTPALQRWAFRSSRSSVA